MKRKIIRVKKTMDGRINIPIGKTSITFHHGSVINPSKAILNFSVPSRRKVEGSFDKMKLSFHASRTYKSRTWIRYQLTEFR